MRLACTRERFSAYRSGRRGIRREDAVGRAELFVAAHAALPEGHAQKDGRADDRPLRPVEGRVVLGLGALERREHVGGVRAHQRDRLVDAGLDLLHEPLAELVGVHVGNLRLEGLEHLPRRTEVADVGHA